MNRGQTPDPGLERHLQDVIETAFPDLDHKPGAEVDMDQAIPDLEALAPVHEEGPRPLLDEIEMGTDRGFQGGRHRIAAQERIGAE